MNRSLIIFLGCVGALVLARRAAAQSHNCTFIDPASVAVGTTVPGAIVGGRGGVSTAAPGARLVARLVDQPRTRVTLSLDASSGTHFELIWDPAVNDGLQHSVVLPGGDWRLSPSVEDDRIQSGQIVIAFSTEFDTTVPTSKETLTFSGKTKALLATASMLQSMDKPTDVGSGRPQIVLSCEDAQVEISSMRLDSRRVAAAVNARSLLDQSVPEPVKETLSILAEIAIDRGKAGAIALVKKKFVEPMCATLTLQLFGLDGEELAFPKTCALLEQLRLDDVLSSGKSLVDAAKDDVRHTLAPALLNHAVLSDETRELARLALDFGNRLLDGESSSVVEIDLLIALLDRLPWSSGFEHGAEIVIDWLASWQLPPERMADLEQAFLEHFLPQNLDDIRDPRWKTVPGCWRAYGKQVSSKLSDGFPVGNYTPSNRPACIANMIELLARDKANGWIRQGIKEAFFTSANLADFLRTRAKTALGDWLLMQYRQPGSGADKTEELRARLPPDAMPVLANACAARLVVAIAKWCSGRDSCSAGDIADVIDHPSKFFKATRRLPESLCWKPDGSFVLPPHTQTLLDLGVRLVAFLRPPAKGEEQRRAAAMVRWLFDLVTAVNGEPTPTLGHVEGIVSLLVDHKYLRAMTEGFKLASEICKTSQSVCAADAPTRKALELIGAVASYAETYERIKGLPLAEAHAARKKALDSLISAATERTGRGGDEVFSIGVPLGFSTGIRWAPGSRATYQRPSDAYEPGFGFHWRLPLAIAWQKLPGDGSWVPTHRAVWVADLGQFARTGVNGASNDISWKDFLGIGAQIGYLIGSPDHTVILAAEGSWAPGLYARDVMIMNHARDGTHVHHLSGAFTLGVTLAYYVPFFDFN